MNTERQLWKITLTSYGSYKVKAKSSEPYDADLAMVAANMVNGSSNGIQVQQRLYVDNESYKDEWYFYRTSNIINDVPTNIVSNDNHACISCAITNVAGYWSLNGFEQFNCSTVGQQEQIATLLHNSMDDPFANSSISQGFSIFAHTEDSIKYTLNSTNYWRDEQGFNYADIMCEIYESRPVMLGFANTSDSPYGSHMTVCVGYIIDENEFSVWLSDAIVSNKYVLQKFSIETYNDFIACVNIQAAN